MLCLVFYLHEYITNALGEKLNKTKHHLHVIAQNFETKKKKFLTSTSDFFIKVKN